MESRWTVKDVVLLLAVLAVFGLGLLSMYQVDRQWQKLAQMQDVMQEQAGDIQSLRQAIKQWDKRLDALAASAQQQTLSTAGVELAAETRISPAFERAYIASQEADYAAGDWLVRAFGIGLKTISPLVSVDAYAEEIQQYVLESLLDRNPETLEWQGLIAESWTVSEDGLTIDFVLRKDVQFSDGMPLTAEDVVFSFEFIMDERIAAPRLRAYLEKIASVEATGTHAVRFVYKEPYFNAMSLAGSMEILPKHFYAAYLDDAQTFNESKGLLLGSGPYRLSNPKTWTPDLGMVELERNPRYWGDVQSPFERLLWKVIENDTARLASFRNGEIDLYGAKPKEAERLQQDEEFMQGKRFMEYMSPTVGYNYIAWNQQREGEATWFADKRVRQAMTWLTDRQRLIEEIYLSKGEVAISPFSPRSRQHKPGLEARIYDLDKAKALLADVGFKDRDGDGLLESADGQPFKIELGYFQDSELTKRIVLLLKDLYARAGVQLVPTPMEWSVMLDSLDKRSFDAIALGWTSGVETDIYQMFHSSQIENGGDNFMAYRNPEMDALIDQARATVDEDQRMALWQQAEQLFYEDQPYTFLMRKKSMAFIDERMKNVEVTRLGLNLNAVPVEWYVPLVEQRY